MKRKIDNLGRITLPSEMRKEININVDDEVDITCDGFSIKIENVKNNSEIKELIKYMQDYINDDYGDRLVKDQFRFILSKYKFR